MSELMHYGILGQKWGVRRYQNPDGTRTEEGKKRYSSERRVFISGSSKTQFEDSGYYRRELHPEVKAYIDKAANERSKFIVGDAPGIDRQVQDYLNSKSYRNVEVYGPGKEVRYLANSKWKTKPVDAPEYEEGSKEWLAKKDKAMAKASTEGLAIILDEGSSATRKNIDRMMDQGKEMKVFELGKDGNDRWIDYGKSVVEEIMR